MPNLLDLYSLIRHPSPPHSHSLFTASCSWTQVTALSMSLISKGGFIACLSYKASFWYYKALKSTDPRKLYHSAAFPIESLYNIYDFPYHLSGVVYYLQLHTHRKTTQTPYIVLIHKIASQFPQNLKQLPATGLQSLPWSYRMT